MKNKTFLVFFILFFCNYSLAENVRVIDGDTIVISNKKIRFSGIDAPELDQECFKNESKVFCGLDAKKILIKKINNQIPKCIEEGIERYKRILAECFVNEGSLSSFLVKNGYAFAYRKYSKKFIEDEEFAKSAKLGLWAMKFEFPWDFRKKK